LGLREKHGPERGMPSTDERLRAWLCLPHGQSSIYFLKFHLLLVYVDYAFTSFNISDSDKVDRIHTHPVVTRVMSL
jgi:hypothetical protein